MQTNYASESSTYKRKILTLMLKFWLTKDEMSTTGIKILKFWVTEYVHTFDILIFKYKVKWTTIKFEIVKQEHSSLNAECQY